MIDEIVWQYECATCGLQTEFILGEFSPENPIVTCPMCDAIWVVEVTDGISWLEPVQEIH